MEIGELEGRPSTLTDDEKEKLAVLKHNFNLVLAADYQSHVVYNQNPFHVLCSVCIRSLLH